jgi:RNA polymerase sigma factor (TIGR02999 family)
VDPQASALPDSSSRVTSTLAEIRGGRAEAWERLVELVYPDLRALAHRQMAEERVGHVLQTTALVHEAWMKLVQDPSERMASRLHFYSAAARAMRRILVDEARRRKAQKRGGGGPVLSITSVLDEAPRADTQGGAKDDVELLERALEAFQQREGQRDKGRVVELRFFAGLTNEEVAEVLGVSVATVKRDWEFARAWLRREMERLSA